jgi:hypothetical protein
MMRFGDLECLCEEVAKFHGHLGGQSWAHAPTDAEDEPDGARRRVGAYIPAGAEIRKGYKSDRREPPFRRCIVKLVQQIAGLDN